MSAVTSLNINSNVLNPKQIILVLNFGISELMESNLMQFDFRELELWLEYVLTKQNFSSSWREPHAVHKKSSPNWKNILRPLRFGILRFKTTN